MIPNLDIDIANIDTSIALIPDRTQLPAVIEAIEPLENKAKKGFNLKVTFKTLEPSPESTVPGKSVPAGRAFDVYFPLQPSDEALKKGDERGYLERIVKVIDAALGTSQGNRPSLSEALSLMHGRNVLATIRIEKDEEYGDKNRISAIAPLG